MKALRLSLLAMSSALVLTACGGGGSSDTTVTTNTKPATPVITPTQPTASRYTGESIVINTKDNDKNDYKIDTINTDAINTLKVDGRVFSVGYAGISSSSFSEFNAKDQRTVVSGTHLSHVKHGFVRDKGRDMEYYFYQGDKTPVANVPKTGRAIYLGSSIYACEGCNGEMIKGTSKLTVNFDNKTLSGTVSNDRTNVALQATISGNTFNGQSGGVKTQGAFFGKNAEEVGGIYVDEGKSFAGTFGAKK